MDKLRKIKLPNIEKHPDRDELFFHITKPKVLQYLVPAFVGLMYVIEVFK